VASRHLKANQT